jgi:pimeloyl-ACP methyl ester carboxylesterase
VSEHTVGVVGGSLWYRTQGRGPALILMGGGPSNADTLEPLASRLADDFTVVTYDRRGYSRSHVSDPAGPAGLPLHADDARRLVADLGSGPVAVFGTSFGALVALELAVTAPAALGAVIVHEPPLGQLLAGDDRLPFDLNLDAEKDPVAALNAIAASVGVTRGRTAGVTRGCAAGVSRGRAADAPAGPGSSPAGPGSSSPAGPGSSPADVELFIRRDAPAIGGYRLDLERLRVLGGRIIVAGSRESHGCYPYQCAQELARRLGTRLAELPGDHAGMIRHPDEFAARLRRLLRSPALHLAHQLRTTQ